MTIMDANFFCLCGDDDCFYYNEGSCECEFPEEACPYFDDEEGYC